jgi:hypothetical protein
MLVNFIIFVDKFILIMAVFKASFHSNYSPILRSFCFLFLKMSIRIGGLGIGVIILSTIWAFSLLFCLLLSRRQGM